MSARRKIYFRLINIAGRLVGGWFVFGGVIFIIYGIASGGALFVVPGLIIAVVGILLICAKPYYPKDLLDPASQESKDDQPKPS
jgi:hypothetical protein